MSKQSVKTVVLTLGNELRGDDYAGILFGNLISGWTSCRVIEGGNAPENVTALVAALEPEEIVIVDAMEMGGRPGDRIVVDGADISADAASTHGTSRMLVEYLTARTGAKVRFIGFQPLSHGVGDRMSTDVEESVREAAGLFVEADGLIEVLGKSIAARRQEYDRKT